LDFAGANIVEVKSGLKKNKKGFSIVQVLVAAAITSVVSLGVVSMMESSRKMQRRTSLMSTLNDLRARIETNLRDQTAFNNTINGNSTSPFAQLKTSSLVTENTATTPVKFKMYDPAGLAWDMLGTAASDTAGPYSGFSEKGTPCTTFSPVLGSGKDECPISYRFLVWANCPKGTDTTCKDPQLTLVARLVYNPSTAGSSTLNQWRNVIQQVSGSSLLSAPDKFDVQIVRTASSISKTFQLSASVNPTLGGSAVACDTSATTNTGGGQCSTAGAQVHPLTKYSTSSGEGLIVESDQSGLLTAVSSGTGQFTIKTPGTYKCIAIAKAFSTHMTLSLYNVTTSTAVTGSALALAGQYAEADARLEVSFNVTAADSVFRLNQECDNNTLKSCTLGFTKNLGGYSATADSNRLVTITCERVDVSY
jgi:Tfp pilus assembly protein PilE